MSDRTLIVKIAEAELFVRETSTNHGPDIEKWWKDTNDPDGYANRYPYCATFCSYCVNDAQRQGLTYKITPAPRFEAVAQWRDWAELHNVHFHARDGFKPEAGDLMHLLPNTSHIGIVTGFDGIFVETIEANTDATGGRDGDGVYRRSRKIDSIGGFIRIPLCGD